MFGSRQDDLQNDLEDQAEWTLMFVFGLGMGS
jgi:hypothetical protein